MYPISSSKHGHVAAEFAKSLRFCTLVVLCFGVSLTASCGILKRDGRNVRPGQALPFKAKLAKGEDRRDFTVSVANKGEDVAAVRESVRFQATRYCLTNFGGSEVDWVLSPTSNDWAFSQDGDRLVFTGRCTKR